MDFIRALKITEYAMGKYKAKHPKWWKRIDGTPLPNDLAVTIASEFCECTESTLVEAREHSE